MKRQRIVSVSGFEAAEMAAAAKKKKQPNQKAAPATVEEGQMKKKMEEENNVNGLVNNWDENWPYWTGDFVDEQMSWGSVWFPFWDVDFSGDAFGALYGDVVWDDDIWNLKEEIPNPSQA